MADLRSAAGFAISAAGRKHQLPTRPFESRGPSNSHPEIIGVEWPRHEMVGNAERSSFIGGAIYTSIDAFPDVSGTLRQRPG